ncbi:hypothetical protein JTB14_015140 [Gonioctena quinquepunctata]|nr:hypothetical protein JTB14_015140 [Gonioctena quinquepunctata]
METLENTLARRNRIQDKGVSSGMKPPEYSWREFRKLQLLLQEVSSRKGVFATGEYEPLEELILAARPESIRGGDASSKRDGPFNPVSGGMRH